MIERGKKLWQQVRAGAETIAYGNPLYNYLLQGQVPGAMQFLPATFGIGDAANGEKLLAGQFAFGGESFTDRMPPWQRLSASKQWHEAMHSFAWLDDLRTLGTQPAQKAAADFIADWLDGQDRYQHEAWAPATLGARLASWIGTASFYLPFLEGDDQSRLMASVARQTRHLQRLLPGNITGLPALVAYKGLIYAALNLPAEGAAALGLALTLLARRLGEEVLADGGHLSRSPRLMLDYLRHLLEIRDALAAAGIAAPGEIESAIPPTVTALRSLRHGDGGFALFHGGDASTIAAIDSVLDRSGIRARGGRALPHLGYERLQAGRCLLLCDAGLPPPRGMDRFAHAGLLSFEFSHGRDRIITNCGGGQNIGEWRVALAATAAHSTVTVADTNAAEVLEHGGIGRRPKHAAARSYELDGTYTIEATHDGYRENFGLVHERKLSLAGDGSFLTGSDVLRGPGLYPYAIRFHLHPKVQAVLAQNGQSALLRTASGQGWKLDAENHPVTLEPSIYCGDGARQRSQQIVIHAKSGADVAVAWRLSKVN